MDENSKKRKQVICRDPTSDTFKTLKKFGTKVSTVNNKLHVLLCYCEKGSGIRAKGNGDYWM
jgi:hypothetical protein